MIDDVKKEKWYDDPFGWYLEQNQPEIYGLQLTKNIALDFLAGLYDIYESFKRNNVQGAIHDTEILATLLIAAAHNVGEEVINEIMSDQFNSMDFDKAINDLIEGESDDKQGV
jgi:DNA polymerase III epsilon subunit-like protein